MFCLPCSVAPLLFWGPVFCHPHCSIIRWSLETVCARVCLCACVSGEPLGARQGSHCQWQPWGRVWPSRTRVLGHSQTSWWLPSVYPVPLTHMSLPSTLEHANLPLTPPSLEVLSCLFGFIACPPFFGNLFICPPLMLSLPVGVSLSLSLPTFSILARLYFFISCAVWGGRWERVGGERGSPRGRQSTLILIRRRTEQSGGWEL